MAKKRKRPVKQTVRMLEKQIQKKVIKYAAEKGVHSIRMYFGPGSQTGWPDVLFLLPGGVPLFIEFKAPGMMPTPKQFIKIKLLQEMNYRVEICDGEELGYKIIDGHLAAVTAFYKTAAKKGKK